MRTFLARARISKQISLKTRSAHPIFASSISSLQALYRVSFKGFAHPFTVGSCFLCVVFGANSLRLANLYSLSLLLVPFPWSGACFCQDI